MTPATLQALRRLLFFSVEEAALLIGNVSPRSWQYWERGQRTIPDDVIDTIQALCEWRAHHLATWVDGIAEMRRQHGQETAAALIWYQTIDDWGTLPDREPLYWRPHCSVVAELASRGGIRLVTFDVPAYTAWLAGRPDSEVIRGAWAATVSDV